MLSAWRELGSLATLWAHSEDSDQTITKTCLYNFDPLKPHFYIVKLGFTGVYIHYSSYFCSKIDCGYSLEHRGGSNEYPQSMFWSEISKILEFFLSETFHILVVKFSVYLNRHVFVLLGGCLGWSESSLRAHANIVGFVVRWLILNEIIFLESALISHSSR